MIPLNRFENFQIIKVEKLSSVVQDQILYNYTLIDFSKVQIIFSDALARGGDSSSSESELNQKDVRALMYGKNVLVRVAAVNEVAEYNDWSFSAEQKFRFIIYSSRIPQRIILFALCN